MPLNLSISRETQSLLQRMYRESRHHQVRQRAHCLLLYSQGLEVSQLLQVFPVQQKTLYNWLNAWQQRGCAGLYNRPGRGSKPTFNDEQKAQIQQWAKRYPRQVKRIVEQVKAQWDITVSPDTIKRVLKSMKMSWRRFRRVSGGHPDPAEYVQKQFALDCLKALDEAGEINLYYLDEVGFSLVPTVPYGWQPIGETVAIPSQQSRRLNVLGLMRRQGILESYLSKQSINSDVVIACIDAFFPEVSTHPIVIVMDKAPIHTSHAMQAHLDVWKARNIHIFELPSYSPELNLIEIVWRFMKYQWMEIEAYRDWQSLEEQVERMLTGFGTDFVINFA